MRGRKNLFASSYYLPSYSIPRLFSSVLHFSPLSTINWQYAWNRLVHSGPGNFFQCRCKGSIDVHLGAFDILKAHTHAATIPALASVKRHFFFYFPFCSGGKFLAICFWMMVSHRRSKRVDIFSETFVTKYLCKRDSNTKKRICILIHNYLKDIPRKKKENVLFS